MKSPDQLECGSHSGIAVGQAGNVPIGDGLVRVPYSPWFLSGSDDIRPITGLQPAGTGVRNHRCREFVLCGVSRQTPQVRLLASIEFWPTKNLVDMREHT